MKNCDSCGSDRLEHFIRAGDFPVIYCKDCKDEFFDEEEMTEEIITLEMDKPFSINIPKPVSCFTFHSDDNWLIEIKPEGIRFNREFYPDSMPGDFAQAFVDILEKCYDVTFEKRKISED